MQAETGRSRGQHATEMPGTAIGREAMTRTTSGRDGTGGGQFLENDVDDAPNVRQT
jgi:hypothetical protein